MKCYLMGHYDVHDPVEYQRYCELVPPIVASYRGKTLIAEHESRVLEGHPAQVTVLVEFPDRITARAFYNSSEYRNIINHRQSSTRGFVQLMSQFAPDQQGGTP